MSSRTTFPELGSLERRLLLSCARSQMDAAVTARTKALLQEPLAWDAILFHARLHSVAPLLHHHLARLGAAEWVPSEARRRLLQLHHRAGYQNRHFAREHGRLVDAFAGAGIPAIVPKGLPLSELIYGSLSLRPLIDLIFLVSPARAQAAQQLLLERGYRLCPPSLVDGLYRWCCPHVFLERVGEVRIKVLVQWDLMTWPRLHGLGLEPLWRRAQRASVAGRETLLLSPVDLVLYLCLQADNHGYLNRAGLGTVTPADLLFGRWTNNRLIRFTDIYEASRHFREALEWERVLDSARAGGILEATFTSLRLTNELIGRVVSDAVLDELRPTQGPRLRRWLLEALAEERRESALAGPARRLIRSSWRSLSGWSQLRLVRLIGLLEFTFPGSHLLRLRYGLRPAAPLMPVYLLHTSRALIRTISMFSALALSRFFKPRSRTLNPSRLPFAGRPTGS